MNKKVWNDLCVCAFLAGVVMILAGFYILLAYVNAWIIRGREFDGMGVPIGLLVGGAVLCYITNKAANILDL